MQSPSIHLDPSRTTWHITWGTYGIRLHGGVAPTVDRPHNQFGEAFVEPDADRHRLVSNLMTNEAIHLSTDQRALIEQQLPEICERGGWAYRTAAAEIDHVHVLCDVDREVHGEKVRRLLKRWLGQELSKRWKLDKGASWWAEEGSNRVVKDEQYLANVYNYILPQRHSRAQ